MIYFTFDVSSVFLIVNRWNCSVSIFYMCLISLLIQSRILFVRLYEVLSLVQSLTATVSEINCIIVRASFGIWSKNSNNMECQHDYTVCQNLWEIRIYTNCDCYMFSLYYCLSIHILSKNSTNKICNIQLLFIKFIINSYLRIFFSVLNSIKGSMEILLHKMQPTNSSMATREVSKQTMSAFTYLYYGFFFEREEILRTDITHNR